MGSACNRQSVLILEDKASIEQSLNYNTEVLTRCQSKQEIFKNSVVLLKELNKFSYNQVQFKEKLKDI